MNIRKTILAGAIATMMAAPTFAAENAPYEGDSEAPAKTELDRPMGDQSTTRDSLDRPQNKGQTSMETAAKDQRQDNPLYSRSAEDLDGVDIVDTAGEEIGSIKNIVLAKDRRSAHAVVSTGGMMGIGTRDVLVSFDELKPVDDNLQINATQKQLEARQEYESEQYVELDGDKPIGGAMAEFSASETKDQHRKPALVTESSE